MAGLQAYTPADLARLRSVQARPRGWSHRVKPRVTEYRDTQTGHWIKVIRDELGNRVRMRWAGQDAHVILPHIHINPWTGLVREERD
ncbi:hypothetical protein ACFYY8_06235 [Streptosporangium sp. NPDC001559]|uniref:hypothetical protein n=1 Tax=Streptosporangium sp. NPDC001559 TaxID=3366187 RepID=UPI0036E51C85